ncbi:hypothetical protein [Mycoplasma ovis]|nr:hypothetical protein [Mycoplasma ovis]
MNSKIFIAVTTLFGGGVELPLYLWGTRNTITTQSLHVPKGFVGSSCKIDRISEELKEFLQEQSKNEESYISVACSNIKENDDIFALFQEWSILLPKNILSESLALQEGNKFDLEITKRQEEGERGSVNKAAVGGEWLKKEMEGEWNYLDPKKLQKLVVSIEIKEGDFSGSWLYLLFPKLKEENEETT